MTDPELLGRLSELGKVYYIYEPEQLAAGLRDAVAEIKRLNETPRTEALTLEQQWREWVNEGDVTEDAVRAGAKVIAASPLIDAPKLSHNEWMGLSRAILEAAFAVSPLRQKTDG